MVTQRSTDLAQSSLPSVIGRERGYSGWYDRSIFRCKYFEYRTLLHGLILAPDRLFFSSRQSLAWLCMVQPLSRGSSDPTASMLLLVLALLLKSGLGPKLLQRKRFCSRLAAYGTLMHSNLHIIETCSL